MKLRKIDYIINLTNAVIFAIIRKIIGRNKFIRKKYNGKLIISNVAANEFLKKKIEDGKPFVAARFGDTELRAVVYYLNRTILKKRSYPQYLIDMLLHKLRMEKLEALMTGNRL